MSFPLMEMMAELVPRIGTNKLFLMRTRWPVMGLYEMNANLCGIIWLVAPVSTTRRLEAGRDLRNANAVDCAGGLARRARTSFGSWIVLTPLGSIEVEQRQLVGGLRVLRSGSPAEVEQEIGSSAVA
jgi:hypothetical protein